MVTRQRDAGAITLGKTNMPEFAAGSHTFNELFGPTRNPYDLSRSAGGSSGGAAAALATGMVALADGTDMGGSLRNPASFCNVVGLRPSHGRVPIWPNASAWSTISVAGPMGRTAADVALLFSVLAGADARDPLSLPGGFHMPASLERDVRGLRIAYAPDIGGLPVESDVREVLDQAVNSLASIGCTVGQACPPLHGADETFETLRAITFAAAYGDLSEKNPGKVREAVRWNAAAGNALQGRQVAQAQLVHARLFRDTEAFLRDYDFIVGPVAQLAPFPVEWEYPQHINGVAMVCYTDWMRSCSRITVTGHPAVSVPCGFTASGLPVGMQIIGSLRDELGLLQIAWVVEQTLRMHERRPALAA
jgi:amidase